MAEDEGIGFCGLGEGQEGAEPGELFGGDGEAYHLLDHDVDRVRRASDAVGVVLDDVTGAEDALDGAGFDVELVVAEAIFPLLGGEVPVRHGAVAEIFADEDVDAADHVSHHAVAEDDDFLEAAQDLADFFGGEPAHVAASGHVGRVEADAASAGHCCDHCSAVWAERCEWSVQIER